MRLKRLFITPQKFPKNQHIIKIKNDAIAICQNASNALQFDHTNTLTRFGRTDSDDIRARS